MLAEVVSIQNPPALSCEDFGRLPPYLSLSGTFFVPQRLQCLFADVLTQGSEGGLDELRGGVDGVVCAWRHALGAQS